VKLPRSFSSNSFMILHRRRSKVLGSLCYATVLVRDDIESGRLIELLKG